MLGLLLVTQPAAGVLTPSPGSKGAAGHHGMRWLSW